MSKNDNLLVYGYKKDNSGEIMDFILGLPKEEKYRIFTILQKIKQKGAKLLALNQIPYETKKITDIVFEIKIDSNRLMYCYIDKGKVCILSAFKKDSQKTRKVELDKAIKRAKEILSNFK
ncbi:MAG: type II toxin-antitoxin system RelE/ParE family toxin [Bacillota bacterium]